MTPSEKIHTFARRYCIERIAELNREHKRAKQQNVDILTGSVWQRTDVLEAILIAIERLRPADLGSRHIAAWRLAEIGQITPLRHKQWKKPEDVQSNQEERARFIEAVRQFASQQDWKRWSVEPLPYRRVLQEEESTHLIARLRERWSITKRWWIPFDQYELPYEALVFDSSVVRNDLTMKPLRAALAHHGIERVYELFDGWMEPDREMDIDLWDPYKGIPTETYWLTEQMDWLFYTTHEHSTTITGDWLLAEIKSAWPRWEEHLFVAPWKQQK